MENGRREPRLSLLQSIADSLNLEVSELLNSEPPTKRAALEIELERMQQGALYQGLGLPGIRVTRSMTDETLEALVGLHQELARRAREAIATPEEAPRANTELRHPMRGKNNHLPEPETPAGEHLRGGRHTTGGPNPPPGPPPAQEPGLDP